MKTPTPTTDPMIQITIQLEHEDAETVEGLLSLLSKHQPVTRDAALTKAVTVGLISMLKAAVTTAEHRPVAESAIKKFRFGFPLSSPEIDAVCVMANAGEPDAQVAASDLQRFNRSMTRTRPNP